MNSDLKFTIHHVGARYGNSSFPELQQLDKGMVKVLYDADADCIDEAQQYNADSQAEVFVLPYCFSHENESNVPFHINNDPFTSSLYQLNTKHENKYSFVYGFDYPLKESFTTAKTIAIDTITMDSLFESNPPPAFSAPDFLSLDVQGAEHDILSGAQKTIQTHTVAVCLEVEFTELYKNQATFGDICKLMDSLGFDFVRFIDLHEFSPISGPVGIRGKGFHSYANAMFLRRVNSILDCHSAQQASLMLFKLAFVAIINQQMEYALQCIENAPIDLQNMIATQQTTQQETPAYITFLTDVIQAINSMPKHFPVSFKQVLASPNGKHYPEKTFFAHVYQLEKTTQYLFAQLQQQPKNYSALESVLIEAGLNNQAQALWQKRVQQSLYIPELAPEMINQSGENPAFFSALINYLQSFTTHVDTENQHNAASFLEHSEALFDDFPEQSKQNFIYSLASYLKSQQQAAAAKPLFEQLLAIKQEANDNSPQTGNIWFHLGEIAFTQGETDQAKKMYQSCLHIIPNHQKANSYLKTISSH